MDYKDVLKAILTDLQNQLKSLSFTIYQKEHEGVPPAPAEEARKKELVAGVGAAKVLINLYQNYKPGKAAPPAEAPSVHTLRPPSSSSVTDKPECRPYYYALATFLAGQSTPNDEDTEMLLDATFWEAFYGYLSNHPEAVGKLATNYNRALARTALGTLEIFKHVSITRHESQETLQVKPALQKYLRYVYKGGDPNTVLEAYPEITEKGAKDA